MSGYDERLLGHTQAVTTKERQEGYNLDLLEESGTTGSIPKVTTPSPTPRVLAPTQNQAEAGYSKEHIVYNKEPTPWYKTKKFIIFGIIALIVIIAICVGVPVGVTQHNKNKNDSAAASTRTTVGPSSTGANAPNANPTTSVEGNGTGAGGNPVGLPPSSSTSVVNSNPTGVQSQGAGDPSASPSTESLPLRGTNTATSPLAAVNAVATGLGDATTHFG